MLTMDELDRVLRVAQAAARAGGEIARARIDAPGQYFTWKRNRDPLVAQALPVQDAILEVIRASFRITRSSARKVRTTSRCRSAPTRMWIVDPICGSLNYMNHDPEYAVGDRLPGRWRVSGRRRLRARARRHVHARSMAAGRRSTGERSCVDQFADGVEAFQRAVVGIDWPSDMDMRKEMLTVVSTLVPVVLNVRMIGSPALALCYVAAGRLHGYSALDLRPWDVAPAAVILQNGGRRADQFRGQLLVPLARTVATWPRTAIIHGRLLQSSQAILALRRLTAQRAAQQAQHTERSSSGCRDDLTAVNVKTGRIVDPPAFDRSRWRLAERLEDGPLDQALGQFDLVARSGSSGARRCAAARPRP